MATSIYKLMTVARVEDAQRNALEAWCNQNGLTPSLLAGLTQEDVNGAEITLGLRVALRNVVAAAASEIKAARTLSGHTLQALHAIINRDKLFEKYPYYVTVSAPGGVENGKQIRNPRNNKDVGTWRGLGERAGGAHTHTKRSQG